MYRQKTILQSGKILVVRLGSFGDVINTLPAFDSLRAAFPSAFIAWLVEDKWKSILDGYSGLDMVIPFEKSTLIKYAKSPLKFPEAFAHAVPFIKNLRKLKFDTVFDFHGNLKSGIMTKLSGAPVRIGFARGFCRESNYLFTNVHIIPGKQSQLRAEKNLSLVRELGIHTCIPKKPGFAVTGKMRADVNLFLEQNMSGSAYVAIHPGTSRFGAYKRWPEENFAGLADRIINELRMNVLFTWGGADERRAAERIIGRMHARAVIAPAIDDLRMLAAFLEKAEMFIGADTGPLHLAAATGTRCVALFGPKDPQVYAPYSYGRQHVIVYKKLPCSPCQKRVCADSACMTSITVEDVIKGITGK